MGGERDVVGPQAAVGGLEGGGQAGLLGRVYSSSIAEIRRGSSVWAKAGRPLEVTIDAQLLDQPSDQG